MSETLTHRVKNSLYCAGIDPGYGGLTSGQAKDAWDLIISLEDAISVKRQYIKMLETANRSLSKEINSINYKS